MGLKQPPKKVLTFSNPWEKPIQPPRNCFLQRNFGITKILWPQVETPWVSVPPSWCVPNYCLPNSSPSRFFPAVRLHCVAVRGRYYALPVWASARRKACQGSQGVCTGVLFLGEGEVLNDISTLGWFFFFCCLSEFCSSGFFFLEWVFFFRLFITRCSIKYWMRPNDAGTCWEFHWLFRSFVPISFVLGIFFWVSDGLSSGAELEKIWKNMKKRHVIRFYSSDESSPPRSLGGTKTVK